jgi:hypothetical protein
MQAVFALSAVAMFVPVIFHTTSVKETDSLNPDAPGTHQPNPALWNTAKINF